jgi:predicted dehydrogenase
LTSESLLRFGVLGAAKIAPAALIRPARAVPDVEVAAVAARDPARARAFARRHGIPHVHPTYDALLADPDLDAVYIPLPNGLHAEWAIRALRAGKHVLCEKPLAANAAEAESMARAAAESGRLLMEAAHSIYHPLAARLKAIVDSGALGTIRRLEAYFCVPLLRPRDIRYRYDLAGGATMDLGCYTVQLLRFLTAAEPEVRTARARLARPQVDRYMRAELQFPNGPSARTVCSFLSPALLWLRARVRGDAGELRVINPYLPSYFHLLTVRTAGGIRRERVPGETSYTHQLRAFAQAARTGAPIPTDGANGAATLRVIDAIYEKAGLMPRGT